MNAMIPCMAEKGWTLTANSDSEGPGFDMNTPPGSETR